MKRVLILLVVAVTLTSMAMNATSFYDIAPAAESMAKHVITAFKQKSSDQYLELFPTLTDFQGLMQEKSNAYGPFLNDAKKDFSIQYERELVPALKASFERIISEGTKQGIDWSHIEFVGVELYSGAEQNPATLNIIFTDKGKEHTISIEKTFVINGQWKVSQFMVLK